MKINQKLCPICNGIIVLSKKWQRSTYVDYEGNIRDGQRGNYFPDKIRGMKLKGRNVADGYLTSCGYCTVT